jgi:transposase
MGKRQSKSISKQKRNRFIDQIRGLDPERILIVPIDMAKFSGKAMICNYYVDILIDPFSFSMDQSGIEKLISEIQCAVKQYNALKVFTAIESTGHYHEPVVRMLEGAGYPVVIMNAYSTAEERNSRLNWSKTDELDLVTIAQALVNNKGTEFKLRSGIIKEMLTIARARRSEVRHLSTIKSEIRGLVDRVWLELQGFYLTDDAIGKRIEVFSDFWGQNGIWILRNCFDPRRVLELGPEGIRKESKKDSIRWRKDTLERLMQAANKALQQPIDSLEAEKAYVKLKLDQYISIQKTVDYLEHQLEGLLVQTPGVLFLSVKGINIVSAAEFYAEAEGITLYKTASALIKKAGTNPLVSQSGPTEAHYGRISRQGNPALRYIISVIGKNLAEHNPYFTQFATRLKNKGLKGFQIYIALGNKFVHVAYALLRQGAIFCPPTWSGESLEKSLLENIADPTHREQAAATLKTLKLENLLETQHTA